MKCHTTFCSNRYDTLQHDIRDHKSRCSYRNDKKYLCCEAEESSLEERKRNHLIICGHEVDGEFYIHKVYPQVNHSWYIILFTASILIFLFCPYIHFIIVNRGNPG